MDSVQAQIDRLESRLTDDDDFIPVTINGKRYEIEIADTTIIWRGTRMYAMGVVNGRVIYRSDPSDHLCWFV